MIILFTVKVPTEKQLPANIKTKNWSLFPKNVNINPPIVNERAMG